MPTRRLGPHPAGARRFSLILALALAALLLPLGGCGTASRTVRLDTGADRPFVFTPHGGESTVRLRPGELEASLAGLARDVPPVSNPLQHARVFLLLTTAAIGNTAGLAVKGPALPGAVQAAALAESQAGFQWAAVGQVQSVAVSAEGAFTIALAPSAVAMTAQGPSGGNPSSGQTSVYISRHPVTKEVHYVGITDEMARRTAEHLRLKGIRIDELMSNLSREDARAVEQALIEIHGLGKNGGSLMNRINAIARSNPKYAVMLRRGLELLESIGYTGP